MVLSKKAVVQATHGTKVPATEACQPGPLRQSKELLTPEDADEEPDCVQAAGVVGGPGKARRDEANGKDAGHDVSRAVPVDQRSDAEAGDERRGETDDVRVDDLRLSEPEVGADRAVQGRPCEPLRAPDRISTRSESETARTAERTEKKATKKLIVASQKLMVYLLPKWNKGRVYD